MTTTTETQAAAPAPKPIKILIVDDEAPARKRLSNLLDDCRAEFLLTIADEAANGEEALGIVERGGIDIVLCDIRMPVMDGIEFARHLSRLKNVPVPRIIFTTAFDQYAVAAFELNAVDYLLKPIKQERLLAALKKARPLKIAEADAVAEGINSRRRNLSIHERGKVVLVPVDDVLYLKAELKYLTVRTMAKEYLLEESLTKLEEEFGDMFTRIHRNSLVATRAIAGFEKVPLIPTPSYLASVATSKTDKNNEHDDDDTSGGANATQWVCNIRGIPEKLPVSRRQQNIIRKF